MHPFIKKSDIPAALGLLFTIGIFFSPLLKLYGPDSTTPAVIVFGLSTIGKDVVNAQIALHQDIQLGILVLLMACWIGTFFVKDRLQTKAYIVITLILTTFPLWLMSFVEGTVKSSMPIPLYSYFSPGFIFIALSLITSTFALIEMPNIFNASPNKYEEIHLLDN